MKRTLPLHIGSLDAHASVSRHTISHSHDSEWGGYIIVVLSVVPCRHTNP